jgi:hypothetical protein
VGHADGRAGIAACAEAVRNLCVLAGRHEGPDEEEVSARDEVFAGAGMILMALRVALGEMARSKHQPNRFAQGEERLRAGMAALDAPDGTVEAAWAEYRRSREAASGAIDGLMASGVL